MSKLITELASRVEAQMRAMVRTLQRPDAELRSVFHGPPLHYMQLVLERLASEGGLELELADAAEVPKERSLSTAYVQKRCRRCGRSRSDDMAERAIDRIRMADPREPLASLRRFT